MTAPHSRTVVLLSEQYRPKVGGAVRYVEGLARGLAQIGCAVKLVVPGSSERVRADEMDVGSSPRCGPEVFRLPRRGAFCGQWRRSDRKLFVRSAKSFLSSHLDRWQPIAVHVAYGHYLYAAVDATEQPTFWTLHNVPPAESQQWLTYAGRPWRPVRLVRAGVHAVASGVVNRLRIVRSRYDCVLAVSPYVASKAAPWTVRKKLRVVGEGIDTTCCKLDERQEPVERTQAGSPVLSLLTVAGIAPHKGQDVAIRTAHELRSAGIEFVWNLVGPVRNQEFADRVRGMVSRYGLEARVRFLGVVSQQELCGLLQRANLYVHPSREEGFCLAALEALAHGTRVVGTATGAIAEFVTDGAGIVVDRARGPAMFHGIVRLLGQPWPEARRRELAHRVRANYSWTAVASRLLDVYREYGS